MAVNLTPNVRLHADIVGQLHGMNVDPEEVTVCHWCGCGLGERKVSLYSLFSLPSSVQTESCSSPCGVGR